MQKLLRSIISFVVPVFWIAGTISATPIDSGHDSKLTVGVVLALSGEAASIGEASKNAMLMAHSRLPDTTRNKMTLIFEDDALQPKHAVSAFNKLVSIDGAEVIVNLSSGTAKAIAPLAEQKRLPFIAIASDPQIVANRKYAVNFWVSPEEEAKLIVPEALRRGYKNIARISTIQEGVLAGNRAFDRENQGRLNLILDEEYGPDVKDFKSFIAKLRNKAELDAIAVSLMPGQLGIFAKQLRQSNLNLPIFGFEILEDAGEVKAADGALVGAWYVNAADPDGKFLGEFRAKYPDASLFAAGNSYDIILLLAKALELGSTSEDINTFLHTVKDFKGSLGTYSASGDNRFTLPAALKVVTKDGFQNLLR